MTSLPSPHSAILWPVNIGEAARRSGLSAKMVRHYESIGLLPKVGRTGNGYRQYSEADVRTLQFIKRGRNLGFSMLEIQELVGLWNNRKRASSGVKRIAQQHVDELTQRIASMQAMQRTLQGLIAHCQGDHRPDCPILDDLSGDCGACPQAINQTVKTARPDTRQLGNSGGSDE